MQEGAPSKLRLGGGFVGWIYSYAEGAPSISRLLRNGWVTKCSNKGPPSRSLTITVERGGLAHAITDASEQTAAPPLRFLQGWEMFIHHSASANQSLPCESA
jgi:hypothetical protein